MTELSFPFENTYAALPDRFYARLNPSPAPSPKLLVLNDGLAEALGLSPQALGSSQGVDILAGNVVPENAEPLAMAYAGHQFGNFVPQLGDGRAILLGELRGTDGMHRDIQLKGAGQTPFSRMGDGRAWLGPVLREYVVSEAMAAFGIPTTRALAAVSTGADVVREAVFPGAVLTRVAQSHLRVGTFQYFAVREDVDALRQLTDYAIARHDPDAPGADNPPLAFLDGVITRQARLVAAWMGVGFIHGVMNTDNTSISGETIDYGPCAFMDRFHPETVFSSIDQMGRYAYRNQPGIAQWNLACLAQSLMPLLADTPEDALPLAQAAVDRFPAAYEAAYLGVMRGKLGLEQEHDEDSALIKGLMEAMAADGTDFTLSFRALANQLNRDKGVEPPLSGDEVSAWIPRWIARVAQEDGSDAEIVSRVTAANPAIIPRNHQVEHMIAAALQGNLVPLNALLGAFGDPYAEPKAGDPLVQPPREDEVVRQTFCGT